MGIIKLGNKPLLSSAIFEHPYEEAEKRGKCQGITSNDWWLYTWNSFGKLTSESKDCDFSNHIFVELQNYKSLIDKEKDACFRKYNLSLPEHCIYIHSCLMPNIPVFKDNIMLIIDSLERGAYIDCLLTSQENIGEISYISRILEKSLRFSKDISGIEKIEL